MLVKFISPMEILCMFEGFLFHPIIVNDFHCFLICNCCVHHKDNEFHFLYSFLVTKKKKKFCLKQCLCYLTFWFHRGHYLIKNVINMIKGSLILMCFTRLWKNQQCSKFIYLNFVVLHNLISQLNIFLYQHFPKWHAWCWTSHNKIWFNYML